jgi:hypothetical protein
VSLADLPTSALVPPASEIHQRLAALTREKDILVRLLKVAEVSEQYRQAEARESGSAGDATA